MTTSLKRDAIGLYIEDMPRRSQLETQLGKAQL